MAKINGKALIKSKTFWFNIVAVIVAVATLFGYGEFQPDSRISEAVTLVAGIVNILLRLKTSQPIDRLK